MEMEPPHSYSLYSFIHKSPFIGRNQWQLCYLFVWSGNCILPLANLVAFFLVANIVAFTLSHVFWNILSHWVDKKI